MHLCGCLSYPYVIVNMDKPQNWDYKESEEDFDLGWFPAFLNVLELWGRAKHSGIKVRGFDSLLLFFSDSEISSRFGYFIF